MKSSSKRSRALLVSSLTLFFSMISGCDQNRPQAIDGIEDFQVVAQEFFYKLEKGQIRRNRGFYTECALDIKSAKGIRISETVCDKDALRHITIRITDPGSRPPSQRIEKIQLSSQSGDTMTAYRGKDKTTINGITVQFDRSGQSVIMDGQVKIQP